MGCNFEEDLLGFEISVTGGEKDHRANVYSRVTGMFACQKILRFAFHVSLPLTFSHSQWPELLLWNLQCNGNAPPWNVHTPGSNAQLPRKPINNILDKCLPENDLTNEDIEFSMTDMNQGRPCSLSNKCRSGKHYGEIKLGRCQRESDLPSFYRRTFVF